MAKQKHNNKFYLGVQNILANEAFGNEYLKYVEGRLINPDAVWDNMNNENLFEEFVAKCQFIQYSARINLGAEISMELAAVGINKENANSFKKDVCGELFDGFMHFIAVNEKNPAVLKSLMDTWLKQGRSLEELDGNGVTPLSVGVSVGNIQVVGAFVEQGIDVTKVDASGFSELHKIINYVEEGRLDASVIKAWKDAGLAVDVVDKFGKTAAEMAADKALVDIVQMIAPYNVQLIGYAQEQLESAYTLQKKLINAKYLKKIFAQEDLLEVVGEDLNKLLLHYLTENHDGIPLNIFKLFLADQDLNIKTNVIGSDGKTALEIMVQRGYNDYSLVMAQKGHGVLELDGAVMGGKHGQTILDYAINYNNLDLLKLVLNSDAIDITKLAKPTETVVLGKAVIAATPLVHAIKLGKVEMVAELTKAGFGITKLDAGNHVLTLIDNLGDAKVMEMIAVLPKLARIHEIDASLDEKVIEKLIEAGAQALVPALINGDIVKIKALQKIGADINQNNGEVIKLFIQHGMVKQITLAIHHGARVTDEVAEAAADKGLSQVLLNAIADKPLPKKVYKAKEKMKILLEMMVKGTNEEEVEEVLGAKSVKRFKLLSKNKVAFDAFCKMKKVSQEEKKDSEYEYKDGQVLDAPAVIEVEEVNLGGAAAPDVSDLD